jgi:Bacteriocin-protection, YdeI or OmpD-Associated
MAYFTHRFETVVARHPVGRVSYTVVYLEATLEASLPLVAHPRLRIEADISGIALKGAWQPAQGRWYLMLPKAALKLAELRIGSRVEVAFRVIAQDDVDVPEELAIRLASTKRLRTAWSTHTPGTQRGLAHYIASAKRAETRAARLAQVEAAIMGTAPLPWARR